MQNLYEILNVSKDSSLDEIKKSYKKLAFKYHPDKNKDKDSQKKFQDLSEAYQILSNPEKKKGYDLYGDTFLNNSSTFVSPIDLFQSLFEIELSKHMSGMSEGNVFFFSDLSSLPFSVNKEKQTIKEIPLKLKELYYGVQKKVFVEQKQQDGTMKNTKYILNIKKGSSNGDNIIVKEGGHYNESMNKYQDLVIKIIEESNNSNIQRIKDDLIIHKYISLTDSLCNLNTTLSIFDEKISIYTENIIQSEHIYYLENKGMPIKNTDNYGKLFIIFKIKYPEYITDYQKETIKQILNHEEDNDYDSSNSYEIYYETDKTSKLGDLKDYTEDSSIGCIQQ